MLGRRQAMDRERASEVAILVLGFLAEEPERLARFLMSTGADPATIAREAAEAAFQVAVLDYLLADESLLLVFCAGQDLKPEGIGEAARLLSADAR